MQSARKWAVLAFALLVVFLLVAMISLRPSPQQRRSPQDSTIGAQAHVQLPCRSSQIKLNLRLYARCWPSYLGRSSAFLGEAIGLAERDPLLTAKRMIRVPILLARVIEVLVDEPTVTTLRNVASTGARTPGSTNTGGIPHAFTWFWARQSHDGSRVPGGASFSKTLPTLAPKLIYRGGVL
ncbi:hypothetical protein D9M68_600660 [compost metagenome]